MKTDIDTCLKEIADWYIKNRQEISEPELETILLKHCEDEAEVQKFMGFLETEPGQLRFKTLLRERKVERVSTEAPAGARGEQRLGIGKQARARAPFIHEAITFDPEDFEIIPKEIEVNSAFPPGSESKLTKAEQTQVDRLIEAVPDENNPLVINYWRDMGDKTVYLEGWGDICLTGQGFPDIGGGERTEKIEFMLRDTDKVLIRKQEEKERPIGFQPPGHLNLIEGGFREFPAGERGYLYGVTWGVYKR